MSWQQNPDLNAKVISRMEFAPGNFVIRVTPDNWDVADFTPGQYCVLGLPGDAPRSNLSDPDQKPVDPEKIIKRAYSISSASVEKEYLEFYVALVRSGALTPRLHNLEIGDKVFLGKRCVGLFTLNEVPDGTNLVLMGTGTGVAPYMSMLRSLVQTQGINSHFAVVHGAKHSWDLGYNAELQTLATMSPHMNYFPVISSPDAEFVKWSGHTGHVSDVWHSDAFEKNWGFRPDPKNTHVFLCGNPLMIESSVEFLKEEGFKTHTKQEPGQVHLEEYWK